MAEIFGQEGTAFLWHPDPGANAHSCNKVTPIGRQSERLHRDLPQSEFITLLGLGHMVHHLDPEAVASAVERAAEKAGAAL